MTQEPLLVGAVNGHDLRFFRPPRRSEPDLPWIALDDLERCLGFPAEIREQMLRALSDGGWRPATTTVACASGIVTIVPHFMAQGLLESCIAARLVPAETDRAYYRAGSQALRAMIAHLPPGERPIHALEAMAAGMRRDSD
jgi:hypothetical protein